MTSDDKPTIRTFTAEDVAALDLRRQAQIDRQREVINRLLAQLQSLNVSTEPDLRPLVNHYISRLLELSGLVGEWRSRAEKPAPGAGVLVLRRCADELEAVLDADVEEKDQ